jgi:hypothetical protein
MRPWEVARSSKLVIDGCVGPPIEVPICVDKDNLAWKVQLEDAEDSEGIHNRGAWRRVANRPFLFRVAVGLFLFVQEGARSTVHCCETHLTHVPRVCGVVTRPQTASTRETDFVQQPVLVILCPTWSSIRPFERELW